MVCELSVPHQETPLHIKLFHLFVIEYVPCPVMLELPLSSFYFPFQHFSSPPSGRKVCPEQMEQLLHSKAGKWWVRVWHLAPCHYPAQAATALPLGIHHAERHLGGGARDTVLQEVLKDNHCYTVVPAVLSRKLNGKDLTLVLWPNISWWTFFPNGFDCQKGCE